MEWVIAVWYIGHGPIVAALIIGLFWTALVHPDRIRSRVEFRLSVLFIGVSVAASVLVPLAVLNYTNEVREGRGPRREAPGLIMYSCAIPPVLTMLAILFGIDSVMAKRLRPLSPTEPR